MWTFDNTLIESPKTLPKIKEKETVAEPIKKSYTKQIYKTDVSKKINELIVFPGYDGNFLKRNCWFREKGLCTTSAKNRARGVDEIVR